MLRLIKKLIPKPIFNFFQPAYHYTLALLGALMYDFPSKNLVVIGVTGTKGKSTTVEILNSIFESSGLKTALASTVRFKIGEEEQRNMHKMTMPGRFFMQKFLRDAVKAGCSHAILEMTSEGAKQYRHKFICLDALIFTNLAPEHIESHGSYEKYVEAKLSIAKEMKGQKKSSTRKVWPSETLNHMVQGEARRPEDFSKGSFFSGPVIVVNADDKEAGRFLNLNIKNKITYSLSDAAGVKANEKGSSFQIGKVVIHSKLPGIFNVYNILGAIACAKHFSIPMETIKRGVENLEFVRGRMEKIKVYQNSEVGREQNFDVVVDYAHTPNSLQAVYKTYNPSAHSARLGSIATRWKLICVLGNTGGGRDKWKRIEMGRIADRHCDQIILTNEDPYDEDPRVIVEEIKKGISKHPVEIIMDRREAINKALMLASEKTGALRQAQDTRNQRKTAVLITGKGTDPYIMEADGKKTPWDDATVVREELNKLLKR